MAIAHIGEIAGLGVSLCWTMSALFFEKAGIRIGSLSVNFIRLFMAIIFLGLSTLLTKGLLFPTDATPYQWFWLGISGVIGFFLGDLVLFKSYMVIGSRTAALIMSFSPMLTAIIGWFFLKEKLTALEIVAILISIAGIITAISNRKMKLNIPLKGSWVGGYVGDRLFGNRGKQIVEV
jgi:drug/metabolite transporter (DMT)-like permease